jgi:hypothetical protein
MRTVNITDFVIHSPGLAKVIISYTGDVDSQFIHETLAKKFDNLAAPVQASFKKAKEGVAVGFVRANKAVRAVTRNELSAKYRVMSSNILMDKSDSSLWDVKDGAAGKYLARHGKEDLTALVEAAVQRRADVPGIRHITIARAAKSELVAFVDDDGDIDHGFAVATNDDKVKVVSFTRRIPVTVGYDMVVSISPVTIPASLQKEITASLTKEEKDSAIAYYTRLYGFSPEYVRKITQEINEGTVA